MPDVVNLGQFGAPRESDFSGLSDALYKGAVAGAQLQQNKIAAAKAQKEKSELSLALAKQQFDEQQKNRENTMQAITQLSMYMNDKSPQEQEMFKTTDHYKELSNLVKKYTPEFYNPDTKSIVTLQNKDIYESQLEKIKATNAQTLASGGQLTPGQQAAQDVLDNVDPKLLASALDLASQDEAFISGTPEEKQAAIKTALQAVTQGRGTLHGSPLGSPKDPLGLYQ